MKLTKTLYLMLCLWVGVSTLAGCIEEYEADIPEDDSNLLVVEGAICSGKTNKFILSRTQPLNSTFSPGSTPRMVTGATVSVRGSDGSEYRMQEAGGCYTCLIVDLAPDVDYYLHIETGGDVYESVPQKPIRTEPIEEVVAVQDTPESNIDILVTPAEPSEPTQPYYYSWTYDETWEVHPEYTTNLFYDTVEKKPVFKLYKFPERGWKDMASSTIMVGASQNYEDQHIRRLKLYDIDRGSSRVYYRYSGLVHQRAISKAEYEYELARRQASSEMGGLFTPQPSALPTNIRCLTSKKHVIGFVGCALNTSEYRFFLSPDDFSIYHPRQPDARIWIEDPSEAVCRQQVERGLYLCEWITPMNSPTGTLRTAWAYRSQLDVRSQGAYIDEPSFWSLEANTSY